LTDFYTLEQTPVTCGSIFETREEARAVPLARVDLVACNACSFVFNRTFQPELAEIGAQYETSQAASGHFGVFARSLASDWIARYGLAGKTVLEVGSGDGAFLARLLESGVRRVIGIDPLADVTKDDARTGGRTQVIAESFDESHLDLRADALVCRHTLEHIQDVSAFLGLVRRWAAAGPHRVALFELPATERVFAECAFWDVYHEHCNYFTADSLRYAFELAGLEVLALRRVYGEQYLVVEATARRSPRTPERPAVDAVLGVCEAFSRNVRASVEECQSRLASLRAAAPPLMLWQGAAKTVGFLSVLRDPGVVDGAVDINERRQGQFLPGSALPVYAPAELTRLRPGNIVLMNPVYLTEVRQTVLELDLDIPVHGVNDLLALRQIGT
jgi:SAM-dependent methyltransferase